MVFAFLIIRIPSDHPELLYSHFFSKDGNDVHKTFRLDGLTKAIENDYIQSCWLDSPATNLAEPYLHSDSLVNEMKQHDESNIKFPLSIIANNSFSHTCSLRQQSISRANIEFKQTDSMKINTQKRLFPLEGMIQLSSPYPNELFPSFSKCPLLILWRESDQIIYSLVCYLNETNTLLAQTTLMFLISSFIEYFQLYHEDQLKYKNIDQSTTSDNTIHNSQADPMLEQHVPSSSLIQYGINLGKLYVNYPGVLTAFLETLLPGGSLQYLSITQAKYLKYNIHRSLTQKI